MSFYAIDSYDRRNDHSWYKTTESCSRKYLAMYKS